MHKNCWKENSDLSRCSYSFPNAKIHQHPRKEQAAEQFPVDTSRIANAICDLQHVVSAESEQRKYTSIRAQLTLLPKGHAPWLDVYFGQSYSFVGHQYTLVGQTHVLTSIHLGRTKCPTVSSPRQRISRMGRTMSVTDRYFKMMI